MLPLFDRILLKLSASPTSARQLASALETDISVVHAVLRVMESEGAVKRVKVRPGPAAWHVAPGIGVGYRPDGRPNGGGATPEPLGTTSCRAVTVRGRACHMLARQGGLCVIHAQMGGDRPANT